MDLERIHKRIYEVRGVRIMLDFDLAEVYGTTIKDLMKAVKQNVKRFPEGFAFQLTKEEFKVLKQKADLSNYAHSRRLPIAFTEYGVAMLSSMLSSYNAIDMNINIVMSFVSSIKILGNFTCNEMKFNEAFQAFLGMAIPKKELDKPKGFFNF